MVPECPENTVQLWSGYSLLHFMGNAKSHGQDLGKCTGSVFITMRTGFIDISAPVRDVHAITFLFRFAMLRCAGQLSEEIQHHALHVLQHKRSVRLREQKRLQLLAEHYGAYADNDDADSRLSHFKIHI